MPWPSSTLSRREWASVNRGVTIVKRAGGGIVRVGGVRITVWAAGQPAVSTGGKEPKKHQHKSAKTADATARNAQPRAQRPAGAQPSARQQRSMRRLQEFQERKRAAVRCSIRRKLLRAARHLRWNKMQEFAANYWQERAGRAAAPADSTPARQDNPMAEAGVVGEKRARGSDLDPQAPPQQPSFSPSPAPPQQPKDGELLQSGGAGPPAQRIDKAITAELRAAGPNAIRRDPVTGATISLRRRA